MKSLRLLDARLPTRDISVCAWTQEAVDGADCALQSSIHAGIWLASPGPSHNASAAETEGWQVLAFWLRRHLSHEQRTALARLSLFAASFDTDEAAAVLHGPDADALQRGDAAKVLRGLSGLNAVHLIQPPGTAGQTRYSVQPLMRSVATQLRRELPQAAQDAAAVGFVTHMLRLGGALLAGLDQAAAAAPVAAQLLDCEAPNFAAMLHIVTVPAGTSAGSMLTEDSQRGSWCRHALDDLAEALARWGQLRLAALAACAARDAKCRLPDDAEPQTSADTQHAGQCEASRDAPWTLAAAQQPAMGLEHAATVASSDQCSSHISELRKHEAAAALARRTLAVQQKHLGPSTLTRSKR